MDSQPRIHSTLAGHPCRRLAAIPFAALCGLAAFVLLFEPHALSQLPVNPPTAPSPAPATQSPPQPAPQRAVVAYSGGILSVRASNSSLNQILREIARQTGMKITGGVAEDRVFGNYGPASPARVLGDLLDGTSSNMLLVAGDASKPAELFLSPRSGSATPPSPNTFHDEQSPDLPPQAAGFNRQPPTPQAAAGARASDASEPASGSVASPEEPQNNPPASSSPPRPSPTANPQSPNGVKTPQEIYDELQRLHQQQAAPPQQ